ncbi:CsbD family protein [Cytobacillus sp. NCCP-133]|uniref:CsbD family protein n=1 Tax=Cytobacillus sp. NCCP-133 TaxID=766848 RepID=UPI00222F3B7C|nr:CsbD family protein [Cytobacillus sp. NCCP-133]GLB60868.1 hypothetical protein NCCP133_30000 [Cytobacillus sp. NCCP-133]
MNKQRTNKCNIDQLKGEMKKQYEKFTNNESKETEGNMEKMKGQAKETWGDTKKHYQKPSMIQEIKKGTSSFSSCWYLFCVSMFHLQLIG